MDRLDLWGFGSSHRLDRCIDGFTGIFDRWIDGLFARFDRWDVASTFFMIYMYIHVFEAKNIHCKMVTEKYCTEEEHQRKQRNSVPFKIL